MVVKFACPGHLKNVVGSSHLTHVCTFERCTRNLEACLIRVCVGGKENMSCYSTLFCIFLIVFGERICLLNVCTETFFL